MKFYNIDLHISVIEDLKTIFADLGHTIDSDLLSNHAWVFKKTPIDFGFLNQHNWMYADDKTQDEFLAHYKEKLDEYDGFIVTHTPMLSRLYNKLNKPIICIASTRYEQPYTADKEKWEELNKILLNDNIHLISNNLFDVEYCNFFLNKKPKYIPSLCSYTKEKYEPLRKESILFSKQNLEKFILNSDILESKKLGKYSWKNLYNYSSIIHYPYNISTMSIFEQYCANVPLFFPSKNCLLNSIKNGIGGLSEISFRQVYGFKPGSTLEKGKLDPNNYDNLETLEKWLNYADFYQLKNIQYYDDLYDINQIPFKTKEELQKISNEMKKENEKRKEMIYNSWKEVLNEFERK